MGTESRSNLDFDIQTFPEIALTYQICFQFSLKPSGNLGGWSLASVQRDMQPQDVASAPKLHQIIDYLIAMLDGCFMARDDVSELHICF
jgi:hypothetical protein